MLVCKETVNTTSFLFITSALETLYLHIEQDLTRNEVWQVCKLKHMTGPRITHVGGSSRMDVACAEPPVADEK